MALRVLAHFVPGDRVLNFVAPEADWLDVRWCADDDDNAFYRELPEADVIWHVLRPLSGADLRRGACRAVPSSKSSPSRPTIPLPGLDNVVLTPHVTWYTADTMQRYLAEAVANCRRLRDGLPLANVVNQPTGY